MAIDQGRKRFGELDARATGAIEAIHEVARLGTLLARIIESQIGDWNALPHAGRAG